MARQQEESKMPREFWWAVLALAVIGAIAVGITWPKVESIATIIGALVGFSGATLFRYFFDRRRDQDLESEETVSIARILVAELTAIEVRAAEHADWLLHGYNSWVPGRVVIDKDLGSIVRLPESYPIYDVVIFDAVRQKLGLFDDETAALVVTCYHRILTSARRADRYVNLTLHEALAIAQNTARDEIEGTLSAARRAIVRLSVRANIDPPPAPRRKPPPGTVLSTEMLRASASSGGQVTHSNSLPRTDVRFGVAPSD